MNFMGCIDASQYGACRQACSSATASTRDTFSGCSRPRGECAPKKECLTTFLK
jgi:hypothetical protein